MAQRKAIEVEAHVERRGKPPLSKRGKSNMQEADLFCMTNKERESLEEKKTNLA